MVVAQAQQAPTASNVPMSACEQCEKPADYPSSGMCVCLAAHSLMSLPAVKMAAHTTHHCKRQVVRRQRLQLGGLAGYSAVRCGDLS